jgi:hypothetical protein
MSAYRGTLEFYGEGSSFEELHEAVLNCRRSESERANNWPAYRDLLYVTIVVMREEIEK